MIWSTAIISEHNQELVHGWIPFENISSIQGDIYSNFRKDRLARVALSDYVARHMQRPFEKRIKDSNSTIKLESLQRQPILPYVLERSDVWCTNNELHVIAKATVMALADDFAMQSEKEGNGNKQPIKSNGHNLCLYQELISGLFFEWFPFLHEEPELDLQMMKHVACIMLQEQIRVYLTSNNYIAFLSDGSILPRKSGASHLPMKCPPAIPFQAPQDSPMTATITVDMNLWAKYLPQYKNDGATNLKLSGLLIPTGITLIVGGGYHGKSTMLRAIAVGVYNKIPNDGREYCVSSSSAVTIRAEDGRYVNNCNISPFISNLPTLPGTVTGLDTTHFSSHNASGSTSQATNVMEAIEMGASALLVDEDVSAANFMARDGRMRALVMDESITPLLYRVNGLYKTMGISTIVVVGGVGDWLDVPHQVILLDKYQTFDATKKAQSISYQFSYGHVQYAGKGVVHRLEWEPIFTSNARRPRKNFAIDFINSRNDNPLSLMDNGHVICFQSKEKHNDYDNNLDGNYQDGANGDEEYGCIDTSRMEQLIGKKAQLYGCGACVLWILQQAATTNTDKNLVELLQLLENEIDVHGMSNLIRDKTIFAYRPRIFEVGQAIARMRGIEMEQIPNTHVENAVLEAQRQEEIKKQKLAEIWAARRNK